MKLKLQVNYLAPHTPIEVEAEECEVTERDFSACSKCGMIYSYVLTTCCERIVTSYKVIR